MGHGGSGVSVSNGGRLPPKRFLGNFTTSRGHSGGAESRGHSESAKLDRTSGDEGELGGTSGDEGELGWTGWGADSASSWDGAASGADSASSWDGAASGADSASSWDGAASGAASGADSASATGTWECQLFAPTPVVGPTHWQSVLAQEVHPQPWWPSWLPTWCRVPPPRHPQ